jgi:pilus assembly protein CpaF
VRRFRDGSLGLDAFAPDPLVAVLELLVAARCNVVVSGATSSGKTSLLNAALGCCPPGERIVTIEDTLELLPASDHLVRLEARPATPDGPAPIPLEQLVRTALRLRPDRLVVGEVRGPEVLALVQALNTGHDGSWSTCHANSALDAMHRLETLVIQAAPTWPLTAVREHLTRSIDAVVHVARHHDGARRVIEVGEVVVDRDRLGLRPIADASRVLGQVTRLRA